jgi:hypothetical protein
MAKSVGASIHRLIFVWFLDPASDQI